MENNGILQGNATGIISASSLLGSAPFFDTSAGQIGTAFSMPLWGTPDLIKTTEVGETIEMMYKETSMITYAVYPSPPPEVRVFKIVYSCQDGKWHKSPPIYGKIIPAVSESYEFE